MAEVERKSYLQDVTDKERAFVLPYLLLSCGDSRSRKHSLRELFNGVHYIVRTWQPVAFHTERSAAIAGGVPADVASDGDREQVAALAEEVQQVTGNSVELAYVDQDYTGENAAQTVKQHGIRLSVVKHPMAKRGFLLLSKRWVVERSFAWAAHF